MHYYSNCGRIHLEMTLEQASSAGHQGPVAEYRKANPTFSDKRVRWDYFHAAGKLALSFLCDTLYKYMNDTHMDTALKAIVGV